MSAASCTTSSARLRWRPRWRPDAVTDPARRDGSSWSRDDVALDLVAAPAGMSRAEDSFPVAGFTSLMLMWTAGRRLCL